MFVTRLDEIDRSTYGTVGFCYGPNDLTQAIFFIWFSLPQPPTSLKNNHLAVGPESNVIVPAHTAPSKFTLRIDTSPWLLNFDIQAPISGFTISTREYDATLRMKNQRLPRRISEAIETERITTIFNRSVHGEVLSFLLLKLP